MRLPLVTPVDTRDGTSDKDGRMHNILLETDEMGDSAALRPGLATLGTSSGTGNGLCNFNSQIISIFGTTIAFKDSITSVSTVSGNFFDFAQSTL